MVTPERRILKVCNTQNTEQVSEDGGKEDEGRKTRMRRRGEGNSGEEGRSVMSGWIHANALITGVDGAE